MSVLENSVTQAFKGFTKYGGFEDVLHVVPTFTIGACLRYIYRGLEGCVEDKGGGEGFSFGKYWS